MAEKSDVGGVKPTNSEDNDSSLSALPSPSKKCFVICPIGEPGSDSRAWSDDIFFNLIAPVAEAHGYQAARALEGSRPGEITDNIVADVVSADLVVADLTLHNANVFYELAIRHARATPYIHVAKEGTKIPFDIAATNVVFIKPGTFEGVAETRRLLSAHFQSVVDGSASFDNPLKRYQLKLQAEQTGDPTLKRILALEEEVARLTRSSRRLQGAHIAAAPFSSSKFADFNSQYLSVQDSQLEKLLVNHAWQMVYNPSNNRSKPITFEAGGTILDGRNENENHWRMRNGRLELLQSDGNVHSRFVYVPANRSFQHTCEPDLPSMTGQSIQMSGTV